jgi:nucleoid-associated protein YgaU
MRRNAATFLAVALLIWITGCEEPKNDQDMQMAGSPAATMEPDFVTDDAGTMVDDEGYTIVPGSYSGEGGVSPSTYASGYSTGSGSSYASQPSSTTAGASYASAGSRVHRVAKGDTLFSLARTYYSDARRWKDIYEANRSQVSNPDRIFVGQELVIP